MKQDKILHRCAPSCNFEGNQAVLGGEQRSRKDPHPNRSSGGGGGSGGCPQTRQKKQPCPVSKVLAHSNTASMVPGFAARTLCLIKGPWNGDGQAEKRRRKEDAWYLTSGRGGQMQ